MLSFIFKDTQTGEQLEASDLTPAEDIDFEGPIPKGCRCLMNDAVLPYTSNRQMRPGLTVLVEAVVTPSSGSRKFRARP